MKYWKMGFRFNTASWMVVLGVDPENFVWTPGLIEWQSVSPSQRFDAYSEKSWLYGFLGITVFFARAR